MQISVVIPTFNGLPWLLKSLEGLERQRYPYDEFEVVVVDDGSEDGTLQELQAFQKRSRLHLAPLRQCNRGPAAARNAGLKIAKGDLIAYLDSDCVPEPDWLTTLKQSFSEEPIVGVGGLRRLQPTTLVNRYLAFYRIFEPKVHRGEVLYLVTGNCCFQRTALLEVGGFNEAFTKPGGEEVELCYRLRAQGYRLQYNPQCVVTAFDARTPCQFLRTFYHYGYGLAQVARCCRKEFWTSKRARCWRVLQVLGGPITIGGFTVGFLVQEHSSSESVALATLRSLHLVSYAIGYLRASIAGQQSR